MWYLAGWQVEFPFITAEKTYEGASDLERDLHSTIGAKLEFPRNGREWFDLSPTEAVERISERLGREPDRCMRHVGTQVTNDQFRNPHAGTLDRHARKVVAWVYEEHLTGRLKTQLIDDWTTPLETKRRYSRNGFSEIAAFSYPGAPSTSENVRLLRCWEMVMSEVGPGTDDTSFGWLLPGATGGEVISIYGKSGFQAFDMVRDHPPEGVKRAYN